MISTKKVSTAAACLACMASMQMFAADTAAHAASPAATVGIAAFNMAWAGTVNDFKRHVEVCGAPAVNWCETRAWIERGASEATAAEQARAKACEAAMFNAAGGRAASMMVAPCNAYRFGAPPVRGAPPRDLSKLRNSDAYAAKLSGLRATVENLIEHEHIRVLAFQEVKSAETIQAVLGKFAAIRV